MREAVLHAGKEMHYPSYCYYAVLKFIQETSPEINKTHDDTTLGVVTCTSRNVKYAVEFKKGKLNELIVIAHTLDELNGMSNISLEK